jgi:hypothetical protein
LGFYNLALVSIVCAFSSPASSFIIKKVGGVPRALVLGAFGNGLFILASVLPALKKQHDGESNSFLYSNWFIYLAMIISGICCGIG